MTWSHFPSLPHTTNLVYRWSLLWLICLSVPSHAWAGNDAWIMVALNQERTAVRASQPASQAMPLPPPLPFLDKKAYQADIFTMEVTPDRPDTSGAPCQTPPCAAGSRATLDLEVVPRTPDQLPAPTRYETLVEKSAYVGAVDVGIILLMKQLPASFTKWTAESRTEDMPLKQWQKNVTTPPVIDKDTPSVNISHAYSGSGYYTLCRNTPGFTGPEMRHKFECLMYAVVMSTFWEYGPEAFLEIPSIQDLIVTPLGGAVLGEMFYLLQKKIAANGGELFGSKLLGRIVTVLLNPLEEAVHVLREIAGPIVEQFDLRLQVGYGNSYPDALQPSIGQTRAETALMVQIAGRWPVKKTKGARTR